MFKSEFEVSEENCLNELPSRAENKNNDSALLDELKNHPSRKVRIRIATIFAVQNRKDCFGVIKNTISEIHSKWQSNSILLQEMTRFCEKIEKESKEDLYTNDPNIQIKAIERLHALPSCLKLKSEFYEILYQTMMNNKTSALVRIEIANFLLENDYQKYIVNALNTIFECSNSNIPNVQENIKKFIHPLLTHGINFFERGEDGKLLLKKAKQWLIDIILKYFEENPFIGMNEKIEEIKNIIDGIQEKPSRDQHFILLTGPSGTGKTEIIKNCIAKKYDNRIDIFPEHTKDSQWLGQRPVAIKEFFEGKRTEINKVPIDENKVHIFFIDEMDFLCPAHTTDTHSQTDVGIIQKEITNLKNRRIVLICTTNFPEKIAEAILSRAGTPIDFSLPDFTIRKRMIDYLLKRVNVISQSQFDHKKLLDALAKATVGWSPRQLKILLERFSKENEISLEMITPAFEKERENYRNEFKKRHKVDEVNSPNLILQTLFDPFNKMIALDTDVKESLTVLYHYLNNPEKYQTQLPGYLAHFLLYGPPGTGKTMSVRFLAEATDCLFVAISGGSYKLPHEITHLSQLFDEVDKFNTVIFIDEIDPITAESSPARELLQTKMDGFKQNPLLIVVGATNHIKFIDPPIQRRFRHKIEVPLPKIEQITEIYKDVFEKNARKKLDSQEIYRMKSIQIASNYQRKAKGYLIQPLQE